MDVTYNENRNLRKMLHLCCYSPLVSAYVTLAKYRTNQEDSVMFEEAMSRIRFTDTSVSQTH